MEKRSQVAIVKAAERQGLLSEAETVRHRACELLGKLEAECDHQGSVVALREVRECLETLGTLLNRAVGLADFSDAAILEEAERRGLGRIIIYESGGSGYQQSIS